MICAVCGQEYRLAHNCAGVVLPMCRRGIRAVPYRFRSALLPSAGLENCYLGRSLDSPRSARSECYILRRGGLDSLRRDYLPDHLFPVLLRVIRGARMDGADDCDPDRNRRGFELGISRYLLSCSWPVPCGRQMVFGGAEVHGCDASVSSRLVGADLWGFGFDRDRGRGLAWIAVLMLVFEEVEGIARLKRS